MKLANKLDTYLPLPRGREEVMVVSKIGTLLPSSQPVTSLVLLPKVGSGSLLDSHGPRVFLYFNAYH